MQIIIYDKMKKLILHIPHSSTNIPFLDGFVDDEKFEYSYRHYIMEQLNLELFLTLNLNLLRFLIYSKSIHSIYLNVNNNLKNNVKIPI
jgi:hypothetical protein